MITFLCLFQERRADSRGMGGVGQRDWFGGDQWVVVDNCEIAFDWQRSLVEGRERLRAGRAIGAVLKYPVDDCACWACNNLQRSPQSFMFQSPQCDWLQ